MGESPITIISAEEIGNTRNPGAVTTATLVGVWKV